jgi:hypothetical protein
LTLDSEQAVVREPRTAAALSPIQRRFWNDYARVPGANWANIFGVLTLPAQVDLLALGRALDVLLLRHDSLRTTFPIVGETPQQRVAAKLELPLEVTDAREHLPEASERIFEEIRTGEIRRPFDLAKPLMRAHLVRFDARAELILTWHHLIVDGWSRLVLLRELRKLYESCVAHEVADALPPSKAYIDYARYANEQQASGMQQASREYWARTLVAPLPSSPFQCLAKPAATGREDPRDRPAASFKFVMPSELAQGVKNLGWRGFTAMMGAFCLVAHRYQSTPDLIVGSPLNGRDEQQRDLVGLLINLVMVRVRLDAGDTYAGYLRRLREALHSAKEHQSYQLDELVADLGLGRNSFDITRAFFSALETDLPVPSVMRAVNARVEELPNSVRFDTMWYAIRHTDGIVMDCRYCKTVFSEPTIRQLADAYTSALRLILSDSSARISE